AVKEFFVAHKKGGLILTALILLIVFLITQLQSCSVIASQTLGTITASSWPAEDSEITQADMYYTQLEADLQHKIDTVKSRRSGCDEYNYNLGEIGHDPVILISYLCAKYGSYADRRYSR
ncbi:MAG: peptidase M23, partial [Fusicatenibacter sp.]|nr:peptidase M23 [Fusicatenibacter sp.]